LGASTAAGNRIHADVSIVDQPVPARVVIEYRRTPAPRGDHFSSDVYFHRSLAGHKKSFQ
jgi:hypothetical protein